MHRAGIANIYYYITIFFMLFHLYCIIFDSRQLYYYTGPQPKQNRLTTANPKSTAFSLPQNFNTLHHPSKFTTQLQETPQISAMYHQIYADDLVNRYRT